MGRPIDVTLDQDVYDGLVKYLEREFGSARAKSLIVNLAVREFLQRKGILANPRGKAKAKPDQGSLLRKHYYQNFFLFLVNIGILPKSASQFTMVPPFFFSPVTISYQSAPSGK